MCRLFLSINVKLDDITLMNFFTQSNKKANTPGLSNPLDSDYHLDGYGIFWLDDTNELALYKSAEPYILDYNFRGIFEQVVQSRFVIGHIRNIGKTSIGDPSVTNSHPFICSHYLLAHNGFIKNFSQHKSQILDFISNKYIGKICGETDTEHLFYCLLTIIDNLKFSHIEDAYDSIELYQMAWEKLFGLFEINSIELVGNFIFSDMNKVMIVRYVSPNFSLSELDNTNNLNKSSKNYLPSLYYCSDVTNSRVLVCSEPVNLQYKLVEPNTFIIFDIN